MTQDADRGWRATFYTTGMEHSPTSATGTAWERTPWHAAQRAAREALNSTMNLEGQWRSKTDDEELAAAARQLSYTTGALSAHARHDRPHRSERAPGAVSWRS